MRLRLIEKRREAADDTTSFIFFPEGRLTWRAGQFLHYVLPHAEADDRKEDRYFTIASAPHETNVRLTTRFANGSGSTYKHALQALAFGATIEAGELDGDFVIDDPEGESIFIAGGIGITPFRAMLVDLDKRGVDINATLLYSNPDVDIIFKRQLDGLAMKHARLTIRYFVSPHRVDKDVLESVVAASPKAMFFVSGPQKMVEALGQTLTTLGVPKQRRKQDPFPGYQAE
jgi:ferredoxin-NADP reductase